MKLADSIPWKAHAEQILSLDYMSSEESAAEEGQEEAGRRVHRLRVLQHESAQLKTIKCKIDRHYVFQVTGREALKLATV